MTRTALATITGMLMVFNVSAPALSADDTLNTVIQSMEKSKHILHSEFSEFSLNCDTENIDEITPSQLGRRVKAMHRLIRKGNLWKTEAQASEASINSDPSSLLYILREGMALEYRQSSGNGSCWIVSSGEKFEFWRHWRYFLRTGFGIFEAIADSNKLNIENLKNQVINDPDYSIFPVIPVPILPDFLIQNQQHYRLSDSMETVDGVACLVVEWAKRDKMWLDPSMGFALRKRVCWLASPAVHIYEIQNKEFQEVHPGLWLPMSQVEILYADPAYQPKYLWDKPLQKLFYKIHFEKNVADSEFEFQPPVGTRVVDSVRDIIYTIYDENKDPFEDPIKQGIGVLKAQKRMMMWRFIGVVAINICIIIAVWLYIRGKERQNRENKKKDDDKAKK